jgi:hypothetical protein
MAWPAVELTESGVEAQSSELGVAASSADESDFRFFAMGLLDEVLDEQQVVELRRQGHAADRDDLALHFISSETLPLIDTDRLE